MEKIVLIDGHSILNRAFYGIPDLTNSEGLHTNAAYGFLNIMFKIIDEEKPDYLSVAFDLSAPTFRHKMFSEYKGTRKPMPPELREQVPLIKEILTSMNIPIITKEGYEADDILGTIAKRCEKEGYNVSIVSGDRDLLQLATDNIKIRIPKTKKGTTEIEDYNTEDVINLYGVTPLEFIDMKALMGDASDNIPGVPKIGEKTAGAIIQKYHSIENAYAHVDEIKPNMARENLAEHYDLAVLSKELATINVNSPIEYDIKKAALNDLFNDKAYELLKRLEFKSIIGRFNTSNVSVGADIEKTFCVIDDFNKVCTLFDALNEDEIGVHLLTFDGKEDKDELAGVSLAVRDEAYFIPVQGFVTTAFLCDKINSVIKNKNTQIMLYDAKLALSYLDFGMNDKINDVSLKAYLLNPLKDKYDYEDIGRDYLSMVLKSRSDILAKSKISVSTEEDIKKACLIACYSAYTALKANDILDLKLAETKMDKLYSEIEFPLIFVLKEMEDNGIFVDRDELISFGKMLEVKISDVEKEIFALAGEEFNINSPKQLGEILFEKMKLPGGKKTKTGFSTSADILEKLAEDYPFVSKILSYRQLTKLKSTYVEGLLPYIMEDGRIHGKFNQTITATGRISSTEPNLQNIPIRFELGKQIRKVFIPKKDFVFLDSDYSQIELRIMAHMSQDEKLIAAYRTDSDIHRITASQVFNTPIEEVTKTQRSNAKAVNFGIIYGISSFGLSQDLSISRAEAKEYIERYFNTYPGVKKFVDNLVSFAKETGYSVTVFGRRRPIPEIKNSNFMQRQFGERIAMNAPIQGTAADIMKIAMINVYKELKARNLKSKLLLQVHDELLVETHKDEIEIVKQILSEQMSSAARLDVPLVVDTNMGNNWLEAH